jgi:hypothetical protein
MKPEREHPAAPEQVEHGFDEGVGRRPRPPDQRRVGRFSDGIEARTQEELRRRRFTRGWSGCLSLRRTLSNAASAKATSGAARASGGAATASGSAVRPKGVDRV